MTTDMDQGYFAWSQEELTQRDASTGVTISQMLDHGSVSFGKFEFESLSWEKWSVFRHDRRQEELEKFNGLVAEKRAYFEEYYKRMRALKALQQQQEQEQQQTQQTELTLDYSVDGSLSEEEQERETGRKVKAEMETGIVVERRRGDAEDSTVVENAAAGDTKLEMPIFGNTKESEQRVSRFAKKLTASKVISKEPSLSSQSRPGPKQYSKPQTRRAVHKPQPPPPPPPRKIIGKTEKSRPQSSAARQQVRKEATKTIPITSRTTTSTITTAKRPSSSSSMRRPLSASGSRPSSTPQRPLSSAGDRGRGIREKVQRSDLSSNRIGTITPGKMGPSIHGTPRMSIMPSTVKSTTTDSKRQLLKEPLVLNNNSTSVKRAERYTLDVQKWRSINLPPKKDPSSSSASHTFSRNKNKEVLGKNTTEPRSVVPRTNVTAARSSGTVRNTTPSRITGSNKIETQKPIPPRTSETPRVGSRPHTSSISVNARKPKVETKKWR